MEESRFQTVSGCTKHGKSCLVLRDWRCVCAKEIFIGVDVSDMTLFLLLQMSSSVLEMPR